MDSQEKERWEKFWREDFAQQNMDYDKVMAKINQIIEELSVEGFTVQEARRVIKEIDHAIERSSKRSLNNSKLANIEIG